MNAHVKMPRDEAITLLRKDLKSAAGKLGRKEVKFLVKMYYEFQKSRIVAGNRIKAVEKNDSEPVACLEFFKDHFEEFEKTMKVPLKQYVENDPVGQWLISQKGIAEVIGAGFLSYLDITRPGVTSASHFISYAGLDPTLSWDAEAGQWKRTFSKHDPENPLVRIPQGFQLLGRKRPYNTELKTLCFKFSKSVVMVGKGELYRKIYDDRKELEIRRNLAGDYKHQAALLLDRVMKGKAYEIISHDDDEDKTDEEKEAELKSYKSILSKGMLIPAHIDARARRHLNTIFLNHLFVVMYETHHKKPAPLPYVFQHLGHVDMVKPPGYTMLTA